MDELSISEEMVLLEVWRLKTNAYGVSVRKQISQVTGRLFPYGTLYSILNKLVNVGYVTKTAGEPVAERGGRRKFYYQITEDGINALKNALELKKKVWDIETERALKAIE
jgi:DNA-binding PadR family transcriptional regulator